MYSQIENEERRRRTKTDKDSFDSQCLHQVTDRTGVFSSSFSFRTLASSHSLALSGTLAEMREWTDLKDALEDPGRDEGMDSDLKDALEDPGRGERMD